MTLPLATTPTKDRLLEAAMGEFAEHGFRDTTVAAISEAAGANIAAINYHFGDKQALYLEAIQRAYESSEAANPVDSGRGEAESPEEVLWRHVRAMCGQIFDPGEAGYFARIFARELAEPSFAIDFLFERFIQRRKAGLLAAVGEIMGPGASEDSVALCTVSVVAQFQFYNFNRIIREIGMRKGRKLPPPEVIADHIVRFSLAGMEAIRKENEGTRE